jgi:hypothetical protein
MSNTRSRSRTKTTPVSIGWAIAVPLVLWWPLTFLAVQLQRPRPGEPGVDMAGLTYLPAAVAWLPMVAVTALVAWLAGRRMRNKPAGERGRRVRGIVCGVLTLIIVPGALLMLYQLG